MIRALFVLLLLTVGSVQAAVIYQQDFETYIPGDLILTDDTAPTNPDVSTEQSFGGSYSMKSVIPAFSGSTPNGYRAEFNGFDVGGDQYLDYDTVYWVSFSVFVPANYHDSSYGDIIWQMHNAPNSGYSWTNPTAQINISNRKWYVERGSEYTGPDVRLGAWTPIVMQVRLSDDSTGFYKIWIDGQLVVDRTGSNSLVEAGYLPFMKMGLYPWVRKTPTNPAYPGDSTAEIVLYHDNIKIGDAAETYESMFPVSGGTGGGTTTTREYITSFPWLSQCVNGTKVIAGTNFDASYFACPSGWSVRTSGAGFGTTPSLNKNGGTNEERWAAITNDTTGNGNVLEIGVAASNLDQGKGRVQFGASSTPFRVLKWRYRFYLNSDHNYLKTYPKSMDWFTLSSAYSDNTWDSANPFVISANLYKMETGTAPDLNFGVRARPYDPATYTPLSNLWRVIDDQIAVPIGSWFTMEQEIYDGDASSGNYKIYITPNGGARTLVVDVNNTTKHPSKTATTGITAITPIKMYTGTAQIQHVAANGGKLVWHIDDLQMLGCQDAVGCDWPVTIDETGGGSGGGTPPTTGPQITSINTNNTIEPSIALNAALGSEMSGVFAGTVTDGTDSETVQALGYPNGTQSVFSTGVLTGIDANATVSFEYAAPLIYDANPRNTAVWDDNFSSGGTYADYATTYGPFASGRTLISTGTNWIRTSVSLGSFTAGDVADVEFFYAAGTGNNALFGCAIGSPGATVRGTIGSLGVGTTTLGTPTFTDTASTAFPGLRVVAMKVTVNTTGTLECGMGPYSSTNGDSVHQMGIRAWKNRAPVTMSRSVTIPSLLPPVNPAPTITAISNFVSGQPVTITGTNLRSVVRAYLEPSEAGESYRLDDFIASADGTSATVTAPFGLPTSGLGLVLEYAPLAVLNTNAIGWSDNSAGVLALEPYTDSNWVTTQGATIVGTSVGYHRTVADMLTSSAGRLVFARFYYKVGSSGRVELTISSPVSRKIIAEGTPGSLVLRATDTGTSHSIYQYQPVDGVYMAEVAFIADETGLYKMGMGTDSDIEGQTVIGLAKQMWDASELGGVGGAVTVATAESKKIKFDSTNGRLKRAGSLFTGTADHLKLYDSNPLLNSSAQLLAHAENVTITSGELTVVEADLTSGSINALQAATDYWFFIFDEDKDPFAFGEIQITVE